MNSKFFEKKTIYIGDAAHSFHPIAGQGWNLGMSDVENLFKLVKEYLSLGLEIGDSFFCKKYNDDNFYNAFQILSNNRQVRFYFPNSKSSFIHW